MKISVNNLSKTNSNLLDECSTAIQRVIQRCFYLMGPETESFEREWGAYLGIDHCITCANGTDALELMMRAVDIQPGDEVILSPNAGFYAATACLLIGAVPVYVDIQHDVPNINPELVRSAIGPKTRAILVTHLYGIPSSVAALRSLADAEGILLLEDCAQAHGGWALDECQRPKKLGTWGDVASFSFYPTKNLGAFGDAGAVVTNNHGFAERLRILHQYGWSSRYLNEVPFGRNSRIDEMQAAVLRVMLPRLDERNDKRKRIVQAYKKVPGLNMYDSATPGSVAHLAVCRIPDRDRIAKKLSEEGISTAVHYPRLDVDQQAIRNYPHRIEGHLDHAHKSCRELLTLPCYPDLADSELDYIVEVLKKCL